MRLFMLMETCQASHRAAIGAAWGVGSAVQQHATLVTSAITRC